MHSLTFAAAAVFVALLACKSSSSSKPSASGASSAESEADEPIGKLAGLTAKDIETRAKKAGYQTKTTDDGKSDGLTMYSFELESDDNYAYVTLVDLGTDAKSHATKMGETGGIAVHFDEPPDKKITPDKLLADILAKKSLGELDKHSLKAALTDLKWTVNDASSDSEDGVTTTSISAESGDSSVLVEHFDVKKAKDEGRLVIEGNRFLNVFVCEDCTKRKEGLLTDMANRRKARKLLAKLTKS
jgi:hypothetical protein